MAQITTQEPNMLARAVSIVTYVHEVSVWNLGQEATNFEDFCGFSQSQETTVGMVSQLNTIAYFRIDSSLLF